MAVITVQPPPVGLDPIDISKEETTTTRGVIDRKHVDWEANKEAYFNIAVMYEGGQLLKKYAEKFLIRRPKEDTTVYQHRIALMTYQNHMGTGLGWWQAEMFSSEPKIDLRPTGPDGKPVSDGAISPDATAFYTKRFLPNCDRNGTSFLDMASEIYKNLLLYRQAFVMIDNPATEPETYKNLAEQQAANVLDPYLCVYSPSQIINWDTDAQGNYNWLLVYQQSVTTDFMQKPQKVDRWYYYDRQQFRVYEAREAADEVKVASEESPVALVRVGYHAMYAQNVVPFVKIELPEGWWLANRAYYPALEQLDTSNVLRWSLRMAALAVPVIFTDDEIGNQVISEYNFLKFSSNSKYEWSEPEGKSWQHLAARIVVLTEEVWRAMYLVAQARSNSATGQSQSGLSKQEDMAPSHDVLNGMGGILRTGLQNILKFVGLARGDKDISPDVTGFVFEDKLTAGELDVVETVVTLGIPSRTFEKAVDKMTARTVLKGANDDVLTAICQEIDAAPTRAELAQQQAEQQLTMRMNQVRTNIIAANKDPLSKAESD